MRKYMNIFKNLGFVTFAIVLSQVVGLVTLPIYTRLIDPGDYGLLALATATLGLLLMFLPMGIHSGSFRFYFKYEKKKSLNKLYGTSIVSLLLLGFIGMILLGSLSGTISSLLGTDDLQILLLIVSLTIPFALLSSFFQNMIRVQERILLYSIMHMASAYVSAGIGITLVLLGYGVKGILIGSLITAIILVSILIVSDRKNISFQRDIKTLKRIESFGFPLIFTGVGTWIIVLSDRYILQYFCGEATVGIYTVSYTIAGVIGTFFMGPIMMVFGPKILQMWTYEGKEKTLAFLRFLINTICLLILPLYLLICIEAKLIVDIIATEKYIGGAIIIPLVAGASLIDIFAYLQRTSFSLAEKTKLLPFIFGVSAFTNIVLNIILIPKFGIMGAAVATFISYSIIFILHWTKGQKLLRIPYDVKYIVKCVGISVIFLMILVIETESIVLTALKIIVAITIYGLLAYKLNLLDIFKNLLTSEK